MGNRGQPRVRSLEAWVKGRLAEMTGDEVRSLTLQKISGDASFRSYYRATIDGRSWVAVDAPPELENSHPFLEVARLLGGRGLNVPRVDAHDFARGFMLVSDLGDDLYSEAIARGDDTGRLYGDAVDAIIRMQAIDAADANLPQYDGEELRRKMQLFPEWMLTRQLGLELSGTETRLCDETFEVLLTSALEQPQVLTHRDYHSRNLLVTKENNPGIVDFQDASIGAVSYDLVSLLRDCYIEWPDAFVDEWIDEYLSRRAASGHLPAIDRGVFQRWFDWMGLQRHLRIAGVFCRLHLRDRKPLYLRDLPQVMRYVIRIAVRYPEFAELTTWLRQRVLPAMRAQQELFGPLDEKLGSFD